MELNANKRAQLANIVNAPDDVIGLIIAILPDVVRALLGLFGRKPPKNEALIRQIIDTELDAVTKINMITALLAK